MYLQEEIVVGIADSRFSSSEDGQPSGFDREVAEEIVHSVYPDAELTFLVVPAEEASYQLRIGEIDLAMGTAHLRCAENPRAFRFGWLFHR